MRIKSFFFAFFVALLFLAGCQSYFENPYFTVEESGLNWLSIRYYNYRKKPIQKINLRIDGNGIINVKSGTSPLVSNPFAYQMDQDGWMDIQQTRIVIPRKDVVPIFQMLVDSGLFVERDRSKTDTITNEAIFVSANIQNKTTGFADDDIFATDPELGEHLRNVIMMYYRPKPKRRAR